MGIVYKNNRLLDNMSSQLDRPFKCTWDKPHCSKRFNRKSDLARHYRIHTNERPYYCDFADCGKSFIQRSALTVHKRTHTGEKPHKCGHHGCDKKFSDSSSLARHRRIHNGTKPYTCPTYCGKQFCRKTTLTRHIQKCHQGEVVAEEVEFKWDDEASESDQDADSDDERGENGEPEVGVDFVPNAQEVKMALRPRSHNYRRDYWPLPCETAQAAQAAQEAHPVTYPHTPTEVMHIQMGQGQLEQQALLRQQAQMDQQIQIERQTQIDQQARIDHQAQIDHQARLDHQARIDHQVKIDHQARIEQQQMEQHFNQMEYLPLQPVPNDNYYQQPQVVHPIPQSVISSYMNAMSLNEQPPSYDHTQYYYDDVKLLDFQLPSARLSGEHYWQ